jgi:hypothetical protein
MNDGLTNDDLIEQLRAADPVDPARLPNAAAPDARALLEDILRTSSTAPESDIPVSAGFITADSDGFTVPPPTVLPSATNRRRRSLALLTSAAAAVIVLIAGVTLFLPSSTEPALAAVQNAAESTARVESGRIATTFTLTGTNGGRSESVRGEANATFVENNLAFTVDLAQLADIRSGDAAVVEGRLVDGVLYGNEGSGQWYAVDAGSFLTSGLISTVDPRSALTTVQDLVEAEEVGSTVVDGFDTTHYQSTIDLADESLEQAGWLAGLDGIDVNAEGEVLIDLYVDTDGLLRQLDITGEATEPGSTESARFELTTRFYDLGGDFTVEAPDPADVLDLTEAVAERLSEGLSGSLSNEIAEHD